MNDRGENAACHPELLPIKKGLSAFRMAKPYSEGLFVRDKVVFHYMHLSLELDSGPWTKFHGMMKRGTKPWVGENGERETYFGVNVRDTTVINDIPLYVVERGCRDTYSLGVQLASNLLAERIEQKEGVPLFVSEFQPTGSADTLAKQLQVAKFICETSTYAFILAPGGFDSLTSPGFLARIRVKRIVGLFVSFKNYFKGLESFRIQAAQAAERGIDLELDDKETLGVEERIDLARVIFRICRALTIASGKTLDKIPVQWGINVTQGRLDRKREIANTQNERAMEQENKERDRERDRRRNAKMGRKLELEKRVNTLLAWGKQEGFTVEALRREIDKKASVRREEETTTEEVKLELVQEVKSANGKRLKSVLLGGGPSSSTRKRARIWPALGDVLKHFGGGDTVEGASMVLVELLVSLLVMEKLLREARSP